MGGAVNTLSALHRRRNTAGAGAQPMRGPPTRPQMPTFLLICRGIAEFFTKH